MEGLVISDAVKDLIINIINIIVLFVIVRGLAYKPVKRFLDARKERVSKELSDAAQASPSITMDPLKFGLIFCIAFQILMIILLNFTKSMKKVK